MQGSKHQPTSESRAEVSALKSFGFNHAEIAKYLDIHEDTLTYHYRREIDTAVIRATAAVANKLYSRAVDMNDLNAQIFWLKTRGKWKEADNEKDSDGKVMDEIKKLRDDLAAKNKKEY